MSVSVCSECPSCDHRDARRALTHAPGWMLGVWTTLVFASRIPLARFEQQNRLCGYSGIKRERLLFHAALSGLIGLMWALPPLFLAQSANSVELVALWTLISCLMTAIAIAFYSVPLASLKTRSRTSTASGGALAASMGSKVSLSAAARSSS